jgi:hypothetical protein
MGRECESGGMTCNVSVGACSPSAGGPGDCVTVELIYDFDEDESFLSATPFVSAFFDGPLRSVSVARVNR